jgi:hypothetical protein
MHLYYEYFFLIVLTKKIRHLLGKEEIKNIKIERKITLFLHNLCMDQLQKGLNLSDLY